MKKIISIASLYMFPVLAFAQVRDADSLFNVINNILNKILPIIISIAVIWFIYNVFNYAILSGDEEAKTKTKNKMIWGIVALFVMVSVWGLVGLLTGTFNLTNSIPNIPLLPRI